MEIWLKLTSHCVTIKQPLSIVKIAKEIGDQAGEARA